MYTLVDNGIAEEMKYDNNFGYVLGNNGYFVNTDYKVLQSQTSGVFLQCMKISYNGRTELYYVADDYRPMSAMFAGIMPDTFITIAINLFANVIEVRNNGFLITQNIDLSWNKIFVDANTLKVKLVYLPINVKTFDSYASFENELRSGMVKVINKILTDPNDKIQQFIADLCNGSLSLEDVYNRLRGAGTKQMVKLQQQDYSVSRAAQGESIRIVAMNAQEHFEIIVNQDQMLIGKKAELVDVVIPFNRMISRKHCKVTRYNGNFYITDEGSANGTYVNRKRIAPNQPCQIKRGDMIRLADSDFQIV